MNKLRLELVMKLHGDTGTSLAKFLNMARATFSAKINETNGAEFTQREIAMIREKYALSPRDVVAIFFDSKVSKKEIKQLSIMEYANERIMYSLFGIVWLLNNLSKYTEKLKGHATNCSMSDFI